MFLLHFGFMNYMNKNYNYSQYFLEKQNMTEKYGLKCVL